MPFDRIKQYLKLSKKTSPVIEEGYIQPEQQKVGYGTIIPAAEEVYNKSPAIAKSVMDTGIDVFQMSSPLALAAKTAGNPKAQGDMLSQISRIPGIGMANAKILSFLKKAPKVGEEVTPKISALQKLKQNAESEQIGQLIKLPKKISTGGTKEQWLDEIQKSIEESNLPNFYDFVDEIVKDPKTLKLYNEAREYYEAHPPNGWNFDDIPEQNKIGLIQEYIKFKR